MKKKIKLLMLAAIYLGICWGIGRFRQVKNFVDSQGADQNMSLADQETADVWKKAVFEGNQKTDDTPWGMTAGWFEMEEEGSSEQRRTAGRAARSSRGRGSGEGKRRPRASPGV